MVFKNRPVTQWFSRTVFECDREHGIDFKLKEWTSASSFGGFPDSCCSNCRCEIDSNPVKEGKAEPRNEKRECEATYNVYFVANFFEENL